MELSSNVQEKLAYEAAILEQLQEAAPEDVINLKWVEIYFSDLLDRSGVKTLLESLNLPYKEGSSMDLDPEISLTAAGSFGIQCYTPKTLTAQQLVDLLESSALSQIFTNEIELLSFSKDEIKQLSEHLETEFSKRFAAGGVSTGSPRKQGEGYVLTVYGNSENRTPQAFLDEIAKEADRFTREHFNKNFDADQHMQYQHIGVIVPEAGLAR